MVIGCVREIKDNEYRVGLVPGGVKALVDNRHQVVVQAGAGLGSGVSDDEYKGAGAEIVPTAAEPWKRADILVKVKEPLESEYSLMREGQVLFTYLHLAPLPALTQVLLDRKVTGVAYETITRADGSLPLLTPMSEVAGRMAMTRPRWRSGWGRGSRSWTRAWPRCSTWTTCSAGAWPP